MTTLHTHLQTRPIDALIPYARNSRTHSPEQVAQIAASIREFGFTNPVLIDEAGGIIAGHGRVLGARQLGLAEVPCLTLAGLTEAQKRAYVIADNKLALNAGWDDEMLALELQYLADADFDLDLLGFEMAEIRQQLDTVKITRTEIQAIEAQTDAAPPPEQTDYDKEMARKDTTGLLPIVPLYGEHHEAFIILCDNTIDEAWLRNKLGLEQVQQSYKDVKTKRANVVTVQQLRERLGA